MNENLQIKESLTFQVGNGEYNYKHLLCSYYKVLKYV